MKTLLAANVAFCFALFGCSDDDGVRAFDASVMDGNSGDARLDADTVSDAAKESDVAKTSDATLDASSADAASDASTLDGALSDAALSDAASDAQVDATSPDAAAGDLGRVTCRATSDCEPSQTCNAAAPGGVCLGCADEFDCPDPGNMGCFGATACYWKCQSDGDCNAGKRCDGLGRCVIRQCQMGSQDCPAPYVCSKTNGEPGLCERPACDMGKCPSPLLCQSKRCVEP